jgi:hypothetical protein
MKRICIGIFLLLIVGQTATFARKPAAAVVEIFVDAASGSDANTGLAGHPLKTLAKACLIIAKNHWNNIPTTVTISPGTYREAIQIAGTSPTTGSPVTIQATQPGSVIISGADVWTGWQPDTTNSTLLTHSWPYRFGICTVPAGWPTLREIVLRREMIFLNGKMMTQVLALKDIRAGAFFVDEAAGRAYIWPWIPVDLSKTTIEVAVRPLLFESYQVPHLTVKGLTFEHANSCMSTRQRSAVAIVGATDDLLEDTTIDENNWTGLTLYNLTSSTIRQTIVNTNGELGIDGFKNKDITLDEVEASFNNWRGAWGYFMTWETGGAKFLFTHGATFTNFTAIGNQGRGIWFDTDNLDIKIDQAFLSKNRVGGILLEANMGPFSITNSKICQNNQGGIVTNHSEYVTLTGNAIFDNDVSQIDVYGSAGQRTGTNWETGAKFVAVAQDWKFLQNNIAASTAAQLLFSIHQSPDIFLNSLISDGNTWANPATTTPFQFEKNGVPVNVNLSGWQSATKQDSSSTFASSAYKASPCVAP